MKHKVFSNLCIAALFAVSVFFIFPIFSYAQQNESPKAENCFDYYQFQSVEIDLHTEKNVYKSGEEARILGSFTNKNNHALVGGKLILRISKMDPRSSLGPDIIDEWVVEDNINLLPQEKKTVSYAYQLPSGLPTGSYTLTSYFITQDKFNISGLTFTDDIYGGYAQFNVEGREESSMRFDRSGVKANGEPYRIFGFLPKIFPKDAKTINVEVPLLNETQSTLPAKITYELYTWDGMSKGNLIKAWNESATLKSKASKKFQTTIALSDSVVYYLKIKANAKDYQSEIHIRFVKEGFKPRLNDIGVTAFPLKQGEEASIYACYHNTTDNAGKGRITLELEDKKGTLLFDATYYGDIAGDISALAKKFAITKNYDNVILRASLYDGKGKLVEKVEAEYDCTKFSGNICFGTSVDKYWLISGLAIILLAVFLLSKHLAGQNQLQKPIK